jgi:acyl-CoA synthetase (AMP-forming)/AMP-acid ligase II
MEVFVIVGIQVVLDLAASMCGERVCIGGSADGLTFADLSELSDQGAAFLRERRVHHVAFVGLNGPAFTLSVFAAAKAGVPISPLNYRLSDEQLRELLRTLDEPFVIADDAFVSRIPDDSGRVLTCSEFTQQARAASPSLAVDSETAAVLFTSGTTSKPKAVRVTHENLTSYVLQTVEMANADPSDCALISVPPYHIAGLVTVLTNTYAGRRVVHLSDFSPQKWLDLVRSEGVTSAMVVPTMLARIVDCLGDDTSDTPTLRSLSYGGAPISPVVLDRALRAFPETGFTNAYGLTETSSTIAVLGPDDHREAVRSSDKRLRSRLSSAGRAVPGIEFLIRDQSGRQLGPGEAGDLFVRGPQVSGEYVGLGSVLDADGWFATRDRAWLDHDGYLFIEGRTDDTIIRGGENIAPGEIENVLMQHPAVKDVAVVGIPDQEWGERITAVVVAAEGQSVDVADLREWTRGRLRGSKTPDQIVMWPHLAYNHTGKLLRRDIASALIAGTIATSPEDTPVA